MTYNQKRQSLRKRLLHAPCLLVLIFSFAGFVSGNSFTHECSLYDDCVIQEFYLNSSGEPCLGCTVNMTLLYPNQSFKENATFVEQGSGYYTYNAGVLPVSGFYPAAIRGYDEDGDLTYSEQNIINVEQSSTRLIVVVLVFIGISGLLMYASFRIEAHQQLLRWVFFLWSIGFALSSVAVVFFSTRLDPYADLTEMMFILFVFMVVMFVFIILFRLMLSSFSQITGGNDRGERKQQK